MNQVHVTGVFHASPLLPSGVAPADAAIATLPAVADGMPPVHVNGDGRGTIPSACTATMRVPVERAVRGELDEALVDLAPPSGEELAERLRNDPLVALLARLVTEGGAVSPAASVVPFLDAVRISAACFGNPSALVADAVAKTLAQEPARRGAVLARVAAGMQQRAGAAALLAAENGVGQPGLAAALVANRLCWVFPEGSLDAHPDVPLVAAMLGAPVPPASAIAVGRAVEAVARAVLARRAANRATPDDHAFALRFLPPAAAADPASAAKSLALDADAVAWILPSLPRWVTVRELTAGGIEKAVAKKLLTPATSVALASTVYDALRAMRQWAVLSQVTAAVVPVDPAGDGGAIVVSPRPVPTQGTVIAVGLGRSRAAPGGSPALVPGVGQAFAQCMAAFPGVAHADLGPIGLAVVADVRVAARLAFALRDRLGEGRARPAIAMASGQVAGGTDGAVMKIVGPAVSGALRLLAYDEMVTRPLGLSGALGLAVVEGMLCGDGLAVDRSTGGALARAGLREVRSPRAPRGVEIDWAFEWEDRILALVPIKGMSRALELLALARADWDALHSADGPAPVPGTRRLKERRSLDQHLADAEEASDVATAPPVAPGSPYGGMRVADVYFESSDGPAPPTPDEIAEPPAATEVAVEESADEFARASEYMLAGPGTAAPEPEPPAATAAPEPEESATDAAPEPEESPFGAPSDGDPFAAAGAVPGAADYAPAATPGFEGPSTVIDYFGAAPSEEPAQAPESVASAPPPEPPAAVHEAPPPEPPASPAGPGFEMAIEDDDEDEPAAPAYSATPAPPPPEASPARPAKGPAPEAPQLGRRRPPPSVDFGHLLRGYACFLDRGDVVFGRPYGARMVDRHSYPSGGDLDAAYRSFLQDKIREGFLPQAELAGELPRGVTLLPLENDRLDRAWSQFG